MTPADVVVLPAPSRARAVNVWLPLATLNVFHDTLYGELRSSAPRLTPSSKNCTPTTPTLSDAFAVTLIAPETAPAAGDVILTVGACASGTLLTVTATPVEVVVLPAASRARAVNV